MPSWALTRVKGARRARCRYCYHRAAVAPLHAPVSISARGRSTAVRLQTDCARLLCRDHTAAPCGGKEGASCPANFYSTWSGLLFHGSPADGALPAAAKLQSAHVLSAQCSSYAHAKFHELKEEDLYTCSVSTSLLQVLLGKTHMCCKHM